MTAVKPSGSSPAGGCTPTGTPTVLSPSSRPPKGSGQTTSPRSSSTITARCGPERRTGSSIATTPRPGAGSTTDIYSKQVPQKGINRLEVAGDTLYILSDIGVSVFSIPRMEFADTYGRYGSGPA